MPASFSRFTRTTVPTSPPLHQLMKSFGAFRLPPASRATVRGVQGSADWNLHTVWQLSRSAFAHSASSSAFSSEMTGTIETICGKRTSVGGQGAVVLLSGSGDSGGACVAEVVLLAASGSGVVSTVDGTIWAATAFSGDSGVIGHLGLRSAIVGDMKSKSDISSSESRLSSEGRPSLKFLVSGRSRDEHVVGFGSRTVVVGSAATITELGTIHAASYSSMVRRCLLHMRFTAISSSSSSPLATHPLLHASSKAAQTSLTFMMALLHTSGSGSRFEGFVPLACHEHGKPMRHSSGSASHTAWRVQAFPSSRYAPSSTALLARSAMSPGAVATTIGTCARATCRESTWQNCSVWSRLSGPRAWPQEAGP
mmetsp:Transcript_7155/g.18322  ORF Transcript_7155/g.18322 Transcript_7155/m.18322 type:complete len:367 (+) Transcript_7155:525-1625(+)